jgi:hypothetical protein
MRSRIRVSTEKKRKKKSNLSAADITNNIAYKVAAKC